MAKENLSRRNFLRSSVLSAGAGLVAPTLLLPRKSSARITDPDPDFPMTCYGDVYNIINGSPMTGWAKRFDKVVPLEDGHFDFGDIDIGPISSIGSQFILKQQKGLLMLLIRESLLLNLHLVMM